MSPFRAGSAQQPVRARANQAMEVWGQACRSVPHSGRRCLTQIVAFARRESPRVSALRGAGVLQCSVPGGTDMSNEAELEREFWKALKKDRVTMLGLVGVDEGHSQPMSAQLLEEHEERGGPIWFFTARDTDLVHALGDGHRAQLHFSSKGH